VASCQFNAPIEVSWNIIKGSFRKTITELAHTKEITALGFHRSIREACKSVNAFNQGKLMHLNDKFIQQCI